MILNYLNKQKINRIQNYSDNLFDIKNGCVIIKSLTSPLSSRTIAGRQRFFNL